MSESTLITHCGARRVSRDELEAVALPVPQGRWVPVSHGHVLTMVTDQMQEAGFQVAKQELASSKDDVPCHSSAFV